MSAAEREALVGAPRQLMAVNRNPGLRLAVASGPGSGGGLARGFDVRVMSGPRRTVVRPTGELDLSTLAQMETSLEEALAAGTPELVLDLHALEFCDAAGLQVILRARRAAFATGTALWLERPTRIVRRVLEVSGLAWLVDDSAAPRRVTS
jgi:anti-anti-sigma factor